MGSAERKSQIYSPDHLLSGLCLSLSLSVFFFSNFKLLLKNHWTSFNPTWQKSFFGKKGIQDRWTKGSLFLFKAGYIIRKNAKELKLLLVNIGLISNSWYYQGIFSGQVFHKIKVEAWFGPYLWWKMLGKSQRFILVNKRLMRSYHYDGTKFSYMNYNNFFKWTSVHNYTFTVKPNTTVKHLTFR